MTAGTMTRHVRTPQPSGTPYANTHPNPLAEIVYVTPAMAREMLKRNGSNRSLRPTIVRKYANAMRAGLWHLSPDALTESNTGRFQNGQHRLHAVIMSETTQPFIMLRGTEDESYQIMDQGMGRTMADATGLSTRDVATIKQALYGPKQSMSSTPYRIIMQSPALMMELGKGVFAEALAMLNAHIPAKELHRFPAPVRAVLFRLALDPARTAAMPDIITKLAYGANLDATNPLLVLRNDFENRRREKSQQAVAKYMYHKTQRALEAYFGGETLKTIPYAATREPIDLAPLPAHIVEHLKNLIDLNPDLTTP